MGVTSSPRTNAWHLLEVDAHAEKTTVSVVIPARDCQETLDRLVASVRAQRYPAELVEIVVVDDASQPPLVVPDGAVAVRQEDDGTFGAGRARNAGAVEATGDVLLFLDADLLLGPESLGRMLRWYEASPAAVVTATIGFFDPGAINATALDAAIRDRSVGELVGPIATDDQAWREKTFARTHDLTVDHSDLFRVFIGAVMCVPRVLHESVGGLRALGVRGIEDTEYGYRLHNAGGLFVLDRSVDLWHQGKRFFDSAAAKGAKKARAGLVEELIPEPSFRPDGATPRQVPFATIATAEGVAATGIDRLARNDVVVVHDQSVSLGLSQEPDHAASPFAVTVLHDCSLESDAVDRLIARAMELGVGALRAVDPDGRELVTVVRRRGLGRAVLTGHRPDAPAADRAGDLFGDWALPASGFGVTPR